MKAPRCAKIVFSLLLFAIAIPVAGQINPQLKEVLTRIKLGVALGLSKTPGQSTETLATLEPSYRFGALSKDFGSYKFGHRLSIGFRYESTFNSGYANRVALKSYSLNLQYYWFGRTDWRGFAGVGAGMFNLDPMDFDANYTQTRFGFYPRIGAEWRHLSISVDYNFVPAVDLLGSGAVTTSYLGARIGFFIGGGVRSVKK